MQNNGVGTIITLFILMGIGFLMKKRNVLNESSEKSLTQIITRYCVPALMLYNVKTNFSKDFLFKYKSALLIALIAFLLSLLIGLFVAFVFRIDKSRQGSFNAMFSFSNTIFIGVPVITGIFGEKGLPYLMLYYLVNTFTFWSIGVYLIGMDKGRKFFSMESLKRILNPGIISFFIGIYFLYMNIDIPAPLLKACSYLSSMVTPLSTLYMGSVISDIRLSDLHYVKDTVLVIFGRFVIAPMITYMLMTQLSFSKDITQVFVIASALPVMTQVSVIAGMYGKDHKYAAFMTALTTFLFIFIVPIYFSLL